MGKLTEEQRQEVVKRYREGESGRQLAEVFGVGKTVIYSTLRRLNVRRRTASEAGRGPDLTDAVIREYNNGTGIVQLARRYGRTEDAVSLYLRSHGVEIRKRKYKFSEKYFETIDTEAKAYFLGLLYADGCVTGESVLLCLQQRDKPILRAFASELGYNGPIRTHHDKTSLRCYAGLALYSIRMVTDLKEWGCVPRKTFKLTWPENLPEELHRHFIRGLVDGDGTIGCVPRSKKRSGERVCACQFGIIGVRELMLSAAEVIRQHTGVKLRVYEKKRSGRGRLVTIQTGKAREVAKVGSWIYADATVFLERKFATLCDVREYARHIPADAPRYKKHCTECGESTMGKGLCSKHYHQLRHTVKKLSPSGSFSLYHPAGRIDSGSDSGRAAQ